METMYGRNKTKPEIYVGMKGKGITIERFLELNSNTISVIKMVADFFGFTVDELKTKSNSRKYTEPRQMAMYILRELNISSLKTICYELDLKQHETILSGIRTMGNLIVTDRKYGKYHNFLLYMVKKNLKKKLSKELFN